MLRILAFCALLATSLLPVAAASAGCSGSDPAVVSATVGNVTPTGGLNTYHVNVTVQNLGTVGQPNDTLQFVDMYMANQKLDAKGIKPLRPGQSQTVTFTYQRSTGAGNGTTVLHFRLDMHQPAASGSSDCNLANDQTTVRL
jgi:subtilase family serine protease